MKDPLRAALITRHLRGSTPRIYKTVQKPNIPGVHMVKLGSKMKNMTSMSLKMKKFR